MKKISFLFFVSSFAFSQQFPIGSYRVLSDYNFNPSITTQADTIFPLLQNASFNTAMIYVLHNDTTTVQIVLDTANNHGINIILPSVVDYYTSVERYYMDATKDDYFQTPVGDPVPDDSVEKPIGPDNSLSDGFSLQANTPNVSMVSGAKVSPYLYKHQDYRATFRLKYQRTGSVSPGTPVAYIAVKNVSPPPSDTLRDSSFTSQLSYQRFSLNFNSGNVGSYISPPQPPTSSAVHTPLDQAQNAPGDIDYEVKWIGPSNTTVWLDNIRIDGAQSTDDKGDTIPDHYNGPWVPKGSDYDWPRRYRGPDFTDSLFNGYYDAILRHNATTYINKPRLQRFYLTDEPSLNQFMSVRYVNSVLTTVGANTITGKGLGHQAFMENRPFDRYSIEAKPFEIATDPYRFHYDDVLPGDQNYTNYSQSGNPSSTAYPDFSGLQTQIGAFKLAQQNAFRTFSGSWWFYPNVGLYVDSNRAYNREPTVNEIKVQVNLALAYGAKGIMYFNFWSERGYNPTYSPNGFGVLGLIDTAMHPITNNRYGENKWEGIRAINQRLAGAIGTTLMNLTWQGAKSWHNGAYTSGWQSGTYVTAITTFDLNQQHDLPQSKYVETGRFSSASPDTNFIYVVNRRTDPGLWDSDTQSWVRLPDDRDITLTLNNPSLSEILDVYSGKTWIIAVNGSFQDHFTPGEGKLYRVSPSTSWSGTKNVVNSITVPSGVTLTINAGTTVKFAHSTSLTVNGSLQANGNSSQHIIFDSSGTSGGWGGIYFQSNSSGLLNYCNISNATYGVRVTGPYPLNGPPDVHNCIITNNTFGLYYENAGSFGSLISANTIYNNSAHGIYVSNSSPDYIHINTIYNNGGDGISMNASSGNLRGNTIYGNTGHGVYCYNQSSPSLIYNEITNHSSSKGVHCEYNSSADFDSSYGHNIIHNNNYGIGASYNSQMYLYNGLNSIYNNISGAAYIDSSWVYAQGNYWGGGSPGYAYYYGWDFEFDPYLHDNPNPSSRKVNEGGNPRSAAFVNNARIMDAGNDSSSFLDSDLVSALRAMNDGRYEEAIGQYTRRYKSEQDLGKKQYILVQLGNCYGRSNKTDFTAFLDSTV